MPWRLHLLPRLLRRLLLQEHGRLLWLCLLLLRRRHMALRQTALLAVPGLLRRRLRKLGCLILASLILALVWARCRRKGVVGLRQLRLLRFSGCHCSKWVVRLCRQLVQMRLRLLRLPGWLLLLRRLPLRWQLLQRWRWWRGRRRRRRRRLLFVLLPAGWRRCC